MAPAAIPKAKPVNFHFDSAKVTYHAVTRYVQRVLGLQVECEGASYAVAEAHAAAAGMSIEDIQRRIYTPAAAAAASLGLSKFTIGNFSACQIDGVIVTVTERKFPTVASGRRLRVLSEGENRRWVAKYSRRQRGRSIHQTEENGD